MSPAKKYLVALFVVFLHFSGQITSMTGVGNRYFFRWSRNDATALVLDVFLIALVVTLLVLGLGWLVRRLNWPRVERFLGHVFLVALASGLLAAFPRFTNDHPNVVQLIWMVAMAVIGFSLAWSRSKLVTWAANFCLIFSPLVFILSAQMFTWDTWHDPPQTEFAARQAQEPKTPVFLFAFDEWSYPRSTEQDRFLPLFKNLNKLCGQSIVFRQARSPSEDTKYSLPRLIYQTDLGFVWHDGNTYWVDGDKETPATETPSLFQLARQNSYNTYLVGWHLPFSRIVGPQVDYCHSYLYHEKRLTLPGEMAFAAYRNMQYWTDPVSHRLWELLRERQFTMNWLRLNTGFRAEVRSLLADCSDNTFALFHGPLPHAPFIFNADGSYRGPCMEHEPEAYRRHLGYLDTYVGRVVDQLRAVGRFDNALLILTSDHGWRLDRDPAFCKGPDWKRRVPLIIKLPGQQSGHVIDETFCSTQLKPLFEAVFRGQHNTRKLTRLVQDLATPP